MGTNYYHRTSICECCGRYDETHIGKNLTMFQAVVDWETDRRLVASWADWRDRLRGGGEVWDEYRRQIDTEQFIADVEATDPKHRRQQYDWLAAGGYDLKDDWLDADGFSFHQGEFS